MPVPVLDTITLTGTVCDLMGNPASVTLRLGAMVSVRPALAGASGTDEPQPYPPYVPPSGAPAPVLLYTAGPRPMMAAVSGGGGVMQSVTTEDDGTFSVVLPCPIALAYAAGARTDADMDAARGGAYTVQYVAVFPDGRMILFSLSPSVAVPGATLDISQQLSSPPL